MKLRPGKRLNKDLILRYVYPNGGVMYIFKIKGISVNVWLQKDEPYTVYTCGKGFRSTKTFQTKHQIRKYLYWLKGVINHGFKEV